MNIQKKLKYWYLKYTPDSLIKFFRNNKPKTIDFLLHKINSYFFDENSGHGEYRKILEVVKILNPKQKIFIDIGASDGLNSSCTYPFAKSKEWNGLSIEYDEKKFNKMKFLYKNFQNTKVLNSKITPSNVSQIFTDNKIPKNFTFLNIDIDSYDLEVINSILESGYRPDIISMEINEKIPPPIYFSVIFDENHSWEGDHFYGCSISAANSIVSSYDYGIYELIYNNILFLNKTKFKDIDFHDELSAYEAGYLDKPDRRKLFSYNEDVECLQKMNSNEAVIFLNKYFKKYEGRYKINVVKD
tara:strand:+ start:1283 stop:2182 length:900 start_codon:yes stop_codon:yes gene_type:complete